MNAVHEGDSQAFSKVERIRQAANTLGISERTVYRRLRSGKIEQLPVAECGRDTVVSSVSDADVLSLFTSQFAPMFDQIVRQNDMTNDNLSILRREIADRDACIRSLLENQQELTHTIQNLQGQIFELARLALIQPTKADAAADTPLETSFAVTAPAVKRRTGFRGWLRMLLSVDQDR